MVSAGFWPAVGGAERQALELSRALRARGVSVVVLTRRLGGLPEYSEVAGVPVRRLPVYGTGALDSLSFLIGTFGWLLKHAGDYDAIHAHLAGSPALAAALAGRCLGKPVLVKLGGGRGIGELAMSSQTKLGRLKLKLLSLLKPRFLAVVPDLAAEALEYLGTADIEVVPNGVDVLRFKPVSAQEKLALRARLGWPAGKIFLYTGRLSWEKRLSWFVKLWDEAAEGQDATLLLVGEGPEKFLLQGEATASNGRIRLLPANDDLVDYYAAADAFVLPSISEGLSNSLLEAMAAGLVVIASAVGGTAETIEDGRTGLLFARDDAAGAMSCVQRVLSDPELAESLGAQARNECETTYALTRVARHCEELYSLEAI